MGRPRTGRGLAKAVAQTGYFQGRRRVRNAGFGREGTPGQGAGSAVKQRGQPAQSTAATNKKATNKKATNRKAANKKGDHLVAFLFHPGWPGKNGAGERSRTLDLRITNALLYQLSYTG